MPRYTVRIPVDVFAENVDEAKEKGIKALYNLLCDYQYYLVGNIEDVEIEVE